MNPIALIVLYHPSTSLPTTRTCGSVRQRSASLACSYDCAMRPSCRIAGADPSVLPKLQPVSRLPVVMNRVRRRDRAEYYDAKHWDMASGFDLARISIRYGARARCGRVSKQPLHPVLGKRYTLIYVEFVIGRPCCDGGRSGSRQRDWSCVTLVIIE